MARLPAIGASLLTPFDNGKNPRVLDDNDLRTALFDLCPDVTFTSDEIHEYLLGLGIILGSWHAEHDRLDSSKVARAISDICTDLNEVAKTLSAQQNGIHHQLDIEIVNRLENLLALDPEVGSREQAAKFLLSFQRNALKISHAGLIAAAGLNMQVGKSGRRQLDWHDDFTELLLKIAKRAGVIPRLWKDRIEGDWRGWLFQAARGLETFFPPAMRAYSAEAAGKRLERSRTRLEEKHRQNPSSAH
jgi:hypothetical protein